MRHRAGLAAREFLHDGASAAVPAPGVLEAIETADLIVLAPSNPVVSIGAILAIPGIREIAAAARAPVIGVSPIIGGAHVLGMAAQCLTTVGAEVSAAGVAEHYGARDRDGLLDGWLIDSRDAESVARDRGRRDPLPTPSRCSWTPTISPRKWCETVHALADRCPSATLSACPVTSDTQAVARSRGPRACRRRAADPG